jgi:hypothetical protein
LTATRPRRREAPDPGPRVMSAQKYSHLFGIFSHLHIANIMLYRMVACRVTSTIPLAHRVHFPRSPLPIRVSGLWCKELGLHYSTQHTPAYALPSAETVRAALPPVLQERLATYPSVICLPLQWGEMDVGVFLVFAILHRNRCVDRETHAHPSIVPLQHTLPQAFGHLNNVVMGRYFETGRTFAF